MWQTIRHETVHVHLAVPDGASVTQASLSFGHPVIRVPIGSSAAEITYSDGSASLGKGLDEDPPRIASLPVQKISRMPENTTVQYLRQGSLRILGWVRGAQCEVDVVREEDADAAFALCASMRVPRPGVWTRRESNAGTSIPLVPEHAWMRQEYGVPMLFAGHFVAKVVAGPCPGEDEIKAANPGEVLFERRRYPNGEVVVGRSFRTWDGSRYQADTSVWATRARHCCVATIAEFFTPPTDDQVDAVARLCDSTS